MVLMRDSRGCLLNRGERVSFRSASGRVYVGVVDCVGPDPSRGGTVRVLVWDRFDRATAYYVAGCELARHAC